MLTIVGGCYRELCLQPQWRQLFGSGVRAAAAVRLLLPEPPTLITTISHSELLSLSRLAASYNFHIQTYIRSASIEFHYDHPLAQPRQYSCLDTLEQIDPINVVADVALSFSLIEVSTRVTAKKLVYDPQAGGKALPPSVASIKADRLAVVANISEVRSMLTNLTGAGRRRTSERLS